MAEFSGEQCILKHSNARSGLAVNFPFWLQIAHFHAAPRYHRYPNGDKYEGNWFEGQKEGRGEYTYAPLMTRALEVAMKAFSGVSVDGALIG